MLFSLLNFFEDASGSGDTTTNENGWVTWVILGGLVLMMVFMMIIPQRKQKKAQEEMKAKLAVGVNIMTIGGIIGTIVKMDDQYLWLETGMDDQTVILKFTARAIHSIVDAPLSAEGNAPVQNDEDTVDEIK